MPVEHHENFPVASWLLPPALRPPVEAIYAFARGADDFADEGDRTDAERLALLDAFRQDVVKKRYATSDELMLYCRRSANPVGRLLLAPFRTDSPANQRDSDAICSSLQLTNRWRDLLRFQCQRARAMMGAGAPLGTRLPGRIGLEIRAIAAGGLRILDKIEAARGDVFRRRPQLVLGDWIRIGWRAALWRPQPPGAAAR